jgi:DnaK suppressor protein
VKVSKDKKKMALKKKTSGGKDAKVPTKPRPKVKAAPKKVKPKKAATKPRRVAQGPPSKPEDFRKTFMDSLVEKRDELVATLQRLMTSRKEYDGQLTAGDFIDEVDDAQREISAYGHYSLIERKNKELRKIEYLIERIKREEEGFGFCEECGQPIPRERLMVVPEATLCVNCQRELEKLDQRRAMATSTPSGLGSPTRREVSWEAPESPEEEENLTIEYHIGTLPSVDMEETEVESSSEEKEEK